MRFLLFARTYTETASKQQLLTQHFLADNVNLLPLLDKHTNIISCNLRTCMGILLILHPWLLALQTLWPYSAPHPPQLRGKLKTDTKTSKLLTDCIVKSIWVFVGNISPQYHRNADGFRHNASQKAQPWSLAVRTYFRLSNTRIIEMWSYPAVQCGT